MTYQPAAICEPYDIIRNMNTDQIPDNITELLLTFWHYIEIRTIFK